MTGLDFIRNYGGCRLDDYEPQPPLEGEPDEDQEQQPDSGGLSYEVKRDEWRAIDIKAPASWRLDEWGERPVRFIDGKDVGHTIAWVQSPRGYPSPIRLSQVGAVAMHVNDGECRRESFIAETVVSMVVDTFPWQEIESLAAALQDNGFRLLLAHLPDGKPSSDFEKMRKYAENRTNHEMRVMEEAVLAQGGDVSTIIDGLLEPRLGGFDPEVSPVFGVIKTHYQFHLHSKGMQLLYQLNAGERTPIFAILRNKKDDTSTQPSAGRKLPVISWYLRLSGGSGAMPNWGIVRVEVSKRWFESRGCTEEFVNQLSRLVYDYRCRERSYDRAAVSLHPIVRAEETLGAVFLSSGSLTSQFYRLTGL
jgi:hypothetical protein